MQAKGRLQGWNADGQELRSCREGYAGKGQAATLEQQRLTARGRGGSCRTARGLGGIGRLECPNKRGLCAGKGQAAMLTARSLVEAAARDMQAKGRLQPWSSKG